jgi:hypothetical protein
LRQSFHTDKMQAWWSIRKNHSGKYG